MMQHTRIIPFLGILFLFANNQGHTANLVDIAPGDVIPPLSSLAQNASTIRIQNVIISSQDATIAGHQALQRELQKKGIRVNPNSATLEDGLSEALAEFVDNDPTVTAQTAVIADLENKMSQAIGLLQGQP